MEDYVTTKVLYIIEINNKITNYFMYTWHIL